MQNVILRPQRKRVGAIAQKKRLLGQHDPYPVHAITSRKAIKSVHYLQKVFGALHYAGSHAPKVSRLAKQREQHFLKQHIATKGSYRYLRASWSFDRYL